MRKEQLKEAVGELNLVDTVFEADGVSYIGTAVSVMQVYDLIDQLDEPEVLSHDWIDEHKVSRINNLRKMTMSDVMPVDKLRDLLVPKQEITFDQVHDKLREESILSEKSFDYYWNCINDNVEIDEPGNLIVPKQELPVIPKHVADWITKYREKYDLYPALRILENNTFVWGLIYEWYRMNTHKFVNAYLTGAYEVEEEPLYYVINNGNYFLLAKDKADGFVFSTGGNSRLGGAKNSPAKFELTEQEIKDYDERYWAFAKPVEEMEE